VIRALSPGDPALPAVLSLLRDAFAYMEGRIDPPSSLGGMGLADLERLLATGPGFVIEDPDPVACVFGSWTKEALYLGKFAVAGSHRGQGLAHMLIAAAAEAARARGVSGLTLKTRVELTENHAAFARLGFVETARAAHAGYDRPTSVEMRLELGDAAGGRP